MNGPGYSPSWPVADTRRRSHRRVGAHHVWHRAQATETEVEVETETDPELEQAEPQRIARRRQAEMERHSQRTEVVLAEAERTLQHSQRDRERTRQARCTMERELRRAHEVDTELRDVKEQIILASPQGRVAGVSSVVARELCRATGRNLAECTQALELYSGNENAAATHLLSNDALADAGGSEGDDNSDSLLDAQPEPEPDLKFEGRDHKLARTQFKAAAGGRPAACAQRQSHAKSKSGAFDPNSPISKIFGAASYHHHTGLPTPPTPVPPTAPPPRPLGASAGSIFRADAFKRRDILSATIAVKEQGSRDVEDIDLDFELLSSDETRTFVHDVETAIEDSEGHARQLQLQTVLPSPWELDSEAGQSLDPAPSAVTMLRQLSAELKKETSRANDEIDQQERSSDKLRRELEVRNGQCRLVYRVPASFLLGGLSTSGCDAAAE